MTRIVRCTHDKPAGADLCFACIMLNTVNALYAKVPLNRPEDNASKDSDDPLTHRFTQ